MRVKLRTKVFTKGTLIEYSYVTFKKNRVFSTKFHFTDFQNCENEYFPRALHDATNITHK